jgi:sulfur transfer protein SufE
MQVWASAELDSEGRLRLAADSDAELSRGLAAVLVEGLSGLTPQELLEVRCGWRLGTWLGQLAPAGSPCRPWACHAVHFLSL